VLPVKAGAYVELASDAFFETLEAATSENVTPPQLACPASNGFYGDESGSGRGCACGEQLEDSMSAPGVAYDARSGAGGVGAQPVTVVHQGTVGPYETVTLHANVKGALVTWLQNHGFAISASEQPIVDGYSGEGFDFIALRLQPGENVQQMKPVRVVSPGASPTLPLRMVGIGTGDQVAITLYVIGEGRWDVSNFPGAELDVEQVSWDFTASKSNYAELRAAKLAAGDGRTWLTTYAQKGALVSPVTNPVLSQTGATAVQTYLCGDGFTATTIAEAYVHQGALDGDLGSTSMDPGSCTSALLAHADSSDAVSGACLGPSGAGGAGGAGQGGAGGASQGGASQGGASQGGASQGGAGGASQGGAGGASQGGAPQGGAPQGGAPQGGAGGASQGGASQGGASQGGAAPTGPGPTCAPPGGSIDARDFVCGKLDDLAVAFTGLHPRDVWVTRLEASLPHAALADDLTLAPAAKQAGVENWLLAPKATNAPCPLANQASGTFVGPTDAPPRRGGPGRQKRALFLASLLAVAGSLARRALRRRPVGATR
jgi:hypothetical protein